MKKAILLAVLWLTSSAGVAAEWRFFDRVLYRDDFAVICHFWNATIFAPGEKPSCFIGTVFAADLMKREIYYAMDGDVQGMPRSNSERQLKREVLINSLKGEAVERLESIRAAQIAANNAAKEKTAADDARSRYLDTFEAATTLELIKDFEAKYTGNDPDGLIGKLAIHRHVLEYKKYLDDFSNAKTPSDFSRFISAYEQDDRDRLIPEAKKRRSLALADEEKIRMSDEKTRQAREIEAKATARKNEMNGNAGKIAWCSAQINDANRAIARERQIAEVSGYQNKMVLRQAGEVIVYCRENIPTTYAEYKRNGGSKSLSELMER